jgi:hypothetical protein
VTPTDSQRGASEAHRAHNPVGVGSTPTAATDLLGSLVAFVRRRPSRFASFTALDDWRGEHGLTGGQALKLCKEAVGVGLLVEWPGGYSLNPRAL